MSLILYAFRCAGWLLFCAFLGACFWGLLGLVSMLLEPRRGRR